MEVSGPVVVYCAWGFDVGRNVTKTLIERGFDARFLGGGISVWYAAGGARALRPTPGIAPSIEASNDEHEARRRRP